MSSYAICILCVYLFRGSYRGSPTDAAFNGRHSDDRLNQRLDWRYSVGLHAAVGAAHREGTHSRSALTALYMHRRRVSGLRQWSQAGRAYHSQVVSSKRWWSPNSSLQKICRYPIRHTVFSSTFFRTFFCSSSERTNLRFLAAGERAASLVHSGGRLCGRWAADHRRIVRLINSSWSNSRFCLSLCLFLQVCFVVTPERVTGSPPFRLFSWSDTLTGNFSI